jgi:HD-GYP domain-containing protein (c-di-GMP phosphodiesterase class II)
MDFTPIRIKTIMPSKDLTFQLFIFYKEQFLMYRDMGNSIDDSLLGKLKRQRLAQFFIRSEDEINYQKFLDSILDESLSNPEVALENKVSIAEGAASNAVDKINENPESKAAMDLTKKAARSLNKILLQNPDALKSFFGQQSDDNEILMRHCLNVSAYSMSLAAEFSLSEEDVDNLGIAGLLHDFGLTRLDENAQMLFFKNYKEMTHQEKAAYEPHCKIATDLLQKNPYTNEKVLALILHHEERNNGGGYPDKLGKLNVTQEILYLSNCYDKKVTVDGMSMRDALKSLQIDEMGNFDLEMINKFKEMLKKKDMGQKK